MFETPLILFLTPKTIIKIAAVLTVAITAAMYAPPIVDPVLYYTPLDIPVNRELKPYLFDPENPDSIDWVQNGYLKLINEFWDYREEASTRGEMFTSNSCYPFLKFHSQKLKGVDIPLISKNYMGVATPVCLYGKVVTLGPEMD